ESPSSHFVAPRFTGVNVLSIQADKSMNTALSQDNFLLFWRNVLSSDDLLNMHYLCMVGGQRERPAWPGFAYARHRTEYAQAFPYPQSIRKLKPWKSASQGSSHCPLVVLS